ncbi:RHS repeat protein [Acinetobacter sp. 194]|uniref:RHS repeat-associated core domain-containing protein n=1 Tax=Acinetobacter shaoyimingii TaxID=2715164 RepID=UPI00140A2965|nr:RHS repeat-associated core domain-containing protein [Acinetobacter shaoyimingii]NHB58290.1 RHS repeat protein [Acinetobacter shaoyimingii]
MGIAPKTTTPKKAVKTPAQKQSVRTGTGMVAVAPLNTITLADVSAGTKKIDKWLKDNTGGIVDLETLQNVAGSLPIIGNIIALTDAVYDVIEITKKTTTEFPDWLNLGIDLLGIIPLPPGMAASRMALRPALKKLKGQNLKKDISDTVIVLLTNHVNEKVAGELDKFADKAQPLVKKTVTDCGNKGKELGNNFANGLSKIVSGQLFDTDKDLNVAKKSFENLAKTDILRNPGKAASHGLVLLVSAQSIGHKTVANTVGGQATKLISADTKVKINKQITKFRTFSNSVPNKLAPLADPNKAMSFSWLLDKLSVAARNFKKKNGKKTAPIKQNQTTQKDKKRPNGELETIQNQANAKNNPNDSCELNTTGANGNKSKSTTKTKKSITYALGTEFLTHVDAFEFEISSFVLSRRYASNLYQLDDGVFGARWITPFTTQILPKTEYMSDENSQIGEIKKLKGLQYIGADARPISLADLKVGDSIHDQQEGFYYSVISDTVQMISFGTDEKHYFEKYLDVYRLSVIEYKNGMTAAIRYDHIIDNKSYISDILIKHNHQILLHIGFKINVNGKVEDIWSIEKGSLKRPLASYIYDKKGDLIEAITENAAKYEYEYDHHLLTRYTDLTGRGMNLEYDGIEPNSKAFHEWADDGSSEVRLEWDENIRLTYVIDAYGNETEYYYDINGYTYRIVYPDGLEEWFFRDECCRVIRHIDTDASVTEYEFDDNGNLVSMSQPDGSTIYYAYDDKDQMVGMVDAEQGRWLKEYDAKGNIIKEIDPLKRETKYSYNAMGLPTQIIDAKGGTKSLKYNDQGNVISYTDCSGKETKWQYDNRGRVISVENALKSKVEYIYSDFTTEERTPYAKNLPLNAFGQLEKIKYADGLEENFIHDEEGRLLVHIGATGKVTRYDYDLAGFISQRIDPNGFKIKYQWDKLNRLKRLTNENGATFEFFYDVVGRLVKEIDFDGKETVYEYDETNGELKTSIEVAMNYGQKSSSNLNAKDRIQHFVMDSMGRLEQRITGYGYAGQDLEDQQEEEFAYNSHGQIILAKNADSKVEWFYDAVGNLVREHIQDNKLQKTAVWKHAYDEIDDRIKTTRPDGQQLQWLTYGTGHVYGLTLNGEDIVSFERDDLHREVARHYANGLSQFEHYDELGRLAEQSIIRDHENGYASGTKEKNAIQETQRLLLRVYKYDKSGQLVHIQDTRRGDLRYKYDPLGRLLEATSKLGTEKFSFDPASNLLDPQSSGVNTIRSEQQELEASGYNRLINNVVKEYLDQQYQYDAYGQLVLQKSSKGDLHLEWDVLGRLIRSRNAEYSADYRYDAMGRRMSKLSKHHHTGIEQHIIYGWDGDTLAYESNDKFTKHYIYEKDSFVPLIQAIYKEKIRVHDTPVWVDKYEFHKDPLWKKSILTQGFDEVCFYHCDHLGTPQELSNHAGQIVWKAQYKAWGELVSEKTSKDKTNFFENSEILTNNIRFQGQYFDKETDLHYNRHRYYAPNVGRFISKDPIGLLGGHNIYAYAPNPVEWVDPRGLKVKKHCEFDRQNNPCTKQNPSKYARGWQGKGNYKGKDSYKNVVVQKGTVLYALWPNGRDKDPKKNFSNYLVDSKELKTLQRKGGAQVFNDALQIRHEGNTDGAYPMRTQVIKFVVRKDTCMAIGQAQKNGRYGSGGGTQYVIDEKDYGNIINTGQIKDI